MQLSPQVHGYVSLTEILCGFTLIVISQSNGTRLFQRSRSATVRRIRVPTAYKAMLDVQPRQFYVFWPLVTVGNSHCVCLAPGRRPGPFWRGSQRSVGGTA